MSDSEQAANPYATPKAEVAHNTGHSEDRTVASRGSRFLAALLDGIIPAIVLIPIVLITEVSSSTSETSNEEPSFLFLGVIVLALLVWLGLQLFFLYQSQQTIGKKIMKIQIVRKDYSPCGFGRILGLRMIVMGVLGVIPIAGPIISLLDPLLIFRSSNYCLHDDLADTIVVDL